MVGQEVKHFLIKLAGFIFQNKVSQLKLCWKIVIGVRQIFLTGVSCKQKLTQLQICEMGPATGVASILWFPKYELSLSISIISCALKIVRKATIDQLQKTLTDKRNKWIWKDKHFSGWANSDGQQISLRIHVKMSLTKHLQKIQRWEQKFYIEPFM